VISFVSFPHELLLMNFSEGIFSCVDVWHVSQEGKKRNWSAVFTVLTCWQVDDYVTISNYPTDKTIFLFQASLEKEENEEIKSKSYTH
jgi:hypothetical protein